MNPSLSILAGLAAVLLLAAVPSRAQNIVLKDGQIIAAQGVRRDGGNVLAKVKVGDGVGEVGYPVANVARIEFPEPPQRKLAADLLAQGRTDEAFKQINSAIGFYAPFRDVPGSWWTALALLELEADGRAGREAEADAVANDLAKLGAAPPEALRAVKIRQAAGLARRGDPRKAIEMLDPIVKDESVPDRTLPEAWLTLGSAQLALRNYKPALLAYLHVPVYTPDQATAMSAALLGSGQAYAALGDPARAVASLQRLVTDYPNARETPEAKQRLQKLKGTAAPAAK